MARLKNHFEFMAGMYVGGELFFNKYSLLIDFYTLPGLPQDQNIAMDRLSYFIYDSVSRSIFIDEANTTQINLLNKAGLSVLTVPDPGPFDPIVLAALVTKMNAIVEDVLVISNAELISEVSGPLLYVWDSADEEDEIHAIVNDADDTKWWASPAPRFGSYPVGTDVAATEVDQPFPLTWEMLDLDWASEEVDGPEYIVDVVTTPSKKGKKKGTIIKADFGPKPNKK